MDVHKNVPLTSAGRKIIAYRVITRQIIGRGHCPLGVSPATVGWASPGFV